MIWKTEETVIYGSVGGGIFLFSLSVMLVSVACICCRKRGTTRSPPPAVLRSANFSAPYQSPQHLLPGNQESPSVAIPPAPPLSSTASSEHLPLTAITSNDTVITAIVDNSDLGSIYEEEDGTERSIERSHTNTPDLPPRTDEMLHILTDSVSCPSGDTPPQLPPKPLTDTVLPRESANPLFELIAADGYEILLPATLPRALSSDELTQGNGKKSSECENSVDQLSGQAYHQGDCNNRTPNTDNIKSKQATRPLASLEPSSQQSSVSTEEEQTPSFLSPPPARPPKPSPTSRMLGTEPTTNKHRLPPPVTHSSTSLSPSLPHKTSSTLPAHTQSQTAQQVNKVNLTLPPRHIRRYPLPSSSSSDAIDEGPEKDMFLRFNESYHSFTTHFRTNDRRL